MGLDITAYEIAKPTERLLGWDMQKGVPIFSELDDSFWEDENLRIAWCYPGMEQSLENFDQGRIVDVSEGEHFGFRAGSYSGYGRWREDLCLTMLGVDANEVWHDHDQFKDHPFYELINFADNEGTIGPEAAERLAKAFADHAEKYFACHADEYDREKYLEWTKACKLAAGRGMIDFH